MVMIRFFSMLIEISDCIQDGSFNVSVSIDGQLPDRHPRNMRDEFFRRSNQAADTNAERRDY